MTSAGFTAQTILNDKNGVASFDAAASISSLPPKARNVFNELMWRLHGTWQDAAISAQFCEWRSNLKAFDSLQESFSNLVRRIDLDTIRDEVQEILSECRDVSYEREESLRRQLYAAWGTIRDLMSELDEVKRQTCLVGRIQDESWPDSAQDPI